MALVPEAGHESAAVCGVETTLALEAALAWEVGLAVLALAAETRALEATPPWK